MTFRPLPHPARCPAPHAPRVPRIFGCRLTPWACCPPPNDDTPANRTTTCPTSASSPAPGGAPTQSRRAPNHLAALCRPARATRACPSACGVFDRGQAVVGGHHPNLTEQAGLLVQGWGVYLKFAGQAQVGAVRATTVANDRAAAFVGADQHTARTTTTHDPHGVAARAASGCPLGPPTVRQLLQPPPARVRWWLDVTVHPSFLAQPAGLGRAM